MIKRVREWLDKRYIKKVLGQKREEFIKAYAEEMWNQPSLINLTKKKSKL